MTEEALIKGCLQQKRASQKILYDTFSRQMYSICLRYHRDTDLANEALQRAFIKVFNRLSTFKKQGSLGGWIKSIIVTTSIDVLKEQEKLKFEDLDKINDQTFEWEVEDHSLDKIDYNSLLLILDELPTGYRTVFSMYVLDNLKHDEIASILKISVTTSRSQLHKARRILREIVENKFGKVTMKKY